MKFCPSCGQKLEENVFCLDDLSTPPDEKGPRAGIIAVQKPGSDIDTETIEPVYYSDEKGVCITPSMLVIPGKTDNEGPATYAIANITSVKSEKDISARIIGIIGALFGIGLVAADKYINIPAAMSIGIVLIVFGVLMVIFIRPTYHLKIAGSSGEVDALKLSHKHELDRIMTAMNQAVGKRS